MSKELERNADWSAREVRQGSKLCRLSGTENDAITLCEIDERLLRGRTRRSRDDEVQYLLPARREVAELVVDPEYDLSVRCVAAHERALLKEIEQDRPARDLAVVIGARVVLPRRL